MRNGGNIGSRIPSMKHKMGHQAPLKAVSSYKDLVSLQKIERGTSTFKHSPKNNNTRDVSVMLDDTHDLMKNPGR